MLVLRHPEVAYRSCEHCQAWMYDHDSGEVVTDRNGKPQPRPKETKPPCGYPGRWKDDDHPQGSRCPKVSPESNSDLTPENQMAYQHYLECRAVNQFPDDAIVRRNAATIRQIEELVERIDRDKMRRD